MNQKSQVVCCMLREKKKNSPLVNTHHLIKTGKESLNTEKYVRAEERHKQVGCQVEKKIFFFNKTAVTGQRNLS